MAVQHSDLAEDHISAYVQGWLERFLAESTTGLTREQ